MGSARELWGLRPRLRAGPRAEHFNKSGVTLRDRRLHYWGTAVQPTFWKNERIGEKS